MRYEPSFAIAGYKPPLNEKYVIQGVIHSSKDARTFNIEPHGHNLPDKLEQIEWNIVPYLLPVKDLMNTPAMPFDRIYYSLRNELRVRFVWRKNGMKSETPSSYFCRDALRPFSMEGIPVHP